MAQVTISFPDNRLALFQHLAARFGFGRIDKVVAQPVTPWLYQAFWDNFMELKLAAGEQIYFPQNPDAVAEALSSLLAAPVEENWQARIVRDADIFNGKPIIRGYRMRVIDVIDEIASGATIDEIIDGFPFLVVEDIIAAARWVNPA